MADGDSDMADEIVEATPATRASTIKPLIAIERRVAFRKTMEGINTASTGTAMIVFLSDVRTMEWGMRPAFLARARDRLMHSVGLVLRHLSVRLV